jgi:hypothetical protein
MSERTLHQQQHQEGQIDHLAEAHEQPRKPVTPSSAARQIS